jgi:ATP-dependent protease ClpP protease subunit
MVDRGLVAQVWQHLKARDERPRPQIEGRPNLRIEAHDDAPTDLLLYDEIGWFGINAQDVAEVLAGVTGDLNVRINSPGGSAFDGIAIYNLLADHDGRVTVTVDGLAASAASFIAQAGDWLVMNRASQMMIHCGSGLCLGNAQDMAEMVEMLNRLDDTLAGIYADRAGGDVEGWLSAMRAETWYSAAEAVDAKLADEMAPSRKKRGDEDDEPAEEMAARFDLKVFHFAGRDKAPAPPMPARAAPRFVGTAVGPHEGTAKEGTWDAGKEQGRLASPMPVATAKKMYALYDASSVEDGKIVKGACSLPHHFVSEDGTPGAPSRNGVNNALARLNQTQGYSDAEKATAERHLRGHLPSGDGDTEDRIPWVGWDGPELLATNPDGSPVTRGGYTMHVDEWAAATAHLTQQTAPDNWAVATAHLKGDGK